MATNPDGTIDVQVVLTVNVDPAEWARLMMGEHPAEVLQKEVRRSVKARIRNHISNWSLASSDQDRDELVPIGAVHVRGLYDSPVG